MTVGRHWLRPPRRRSWCCPWCLWSGRCCSEQGRGPPGGGRGEEGGEAPHNCDRDVSHPPPVPCPQHVLRCFFLSFEPASAFRFEIDPEKYVAVDSVSPLNYWAGPERCSAWMPSLVASLCAHPVRGGAPWRCQPGDTVSACWQAPDAAAMASTTCTIQQLGQGADGPAGTWRPGWPPRKPALTPCCIASSLPPHHKTKGSLGWALITG